MSHSSEHDDESTVQRAELRARAEQLESAGERLQALAVYEQLVALDRRDSMPLLKMGDLQLKHFAEAVAAYGRAADCYRRDGALAKALAVYTQMRALIRGRAKHLEPRYADLPLRLAEIHAALGQRTEAARLFGEVVGPLVAGGQALLREARAAPGDIDSGLLALEDEITGVLARRQATATVSVDEEALWRADELAVSGHFDEAGAILDDQDPHHPLVREVRDRVAEVEQMASGTGGRTSLHSLYPRAEGDPPADGEDTEVFAPGATAPTAESSKDDAADSLGEGTASPQRPARRRRRAALSGAISRKRRRKGR